MVKKEKTNLYLLGIVGVVAVVALVVLILNGGIETDTTNSDSGMGSCTADESGTSITCTDVTGEAVFAKGNCEVYGADDEACYEAAVYNNDLSCANLLFSMKTTRNQCSVLDKTSEPPIFILSKIEAGESYTYVVAYWFDEYVFSGVQRAKGDWEWENR